MIPRAPLALAVIALAAGHSAPLPAAEPSLFTAPLAAEKPAYLDPDAPIEKRVADLVGRMTLEEKAQALDHKGPDLACFGLRSDKWNQCLNGVKGDPLIAFGHGLSYTAFAYSNLQVSPRQITPDGKVTVSVDVANTGKRAGDEVVQLYVRDAECGVVRAARELRGFKRIRLKPDEKTTVSLEVPARKLAFWDETTHAFVVEPGAFEVMVGASSADIRARERIAVTAAGRWGP